MTLEDEMDRLLMIPGPSPVTREVLQALGQPTVAHTSGELAALIKDCLAGLQWLSGQGSGAAFAFGGSGTLAQEAAVVNLVAPGERLLVVSNGYFGDRFTLIARAHGIQADVVGAGWGTSATAEALSSRLESGTYAAVTITHVDTSTGTAADVPALAGACRDSGALVILDSVCALGGMPVCADDWGVDLVLTGAQKALGVPPGLALLSVSERAMERRRSLPGVSAFYVDLLNWEASMADPQVYFSTHSVNLFYALRAGIEIIRREGVEHRFARHRLLAAQFRAGMSVLGFDPLTAADALAPTLSVLAYPEGIDDARYRAAVAARGVAVAGCLGEFKGRGLRFGHMGNISQKEIVRTLVAAGGALEDAGQSPDIGGAVDAALETSA